MINRRNLYRILHVQPDAPSAIIKASYRTLMTKLDMHPDRGGDHETAALINEAYRILSDDTRRRHYDQSLLDAYSNTVAAGGASVSRAAGQPDPDTGQPYEPTIQHYCPFCMTPHAYRETAPSEAVCIECHSPLSRAPQIKPLHSGRRNTHRVNTRQPLKLFAHWPQHRPVPASLTDLSLDGIQFECAQPWEANASIKIESDLLDAVVSAVYCRLTGSGAPHFMVGARILTLRLHKSRGTFVSVET